MTEITMDPHTSVDQDIPISYNGFALLIRGSVRIGEDAVFLKAGQAGWLDRPRGEGASVLRVEAGGTGARLVLYAGHPQGDPIVSYGPFIAHSKAHLVPLPPYNR